MAHSCSFKTVESIGRTLPDVEVTTAWGQPALKVKRWTRRASVYPAALLRTYPHQRDERPVGPPSALSEHCRRVDTSCPPRGQPPGQCADPGEYHGGTNEGQGIPRFDPIEKGGGKLRRPEAHAGAQ